MVLSTSKDVCVCLCVCVWQTKGQEWGWACQWHKEWVSNRKERKSCLWEQDDPCDLACPSLFFPHSLTWPELYPHDHIYKGLCLQTSPYLWFTAQKRAPCLLMYCQLHMASPAHFVFFLQEGCLKYYPPLHHHFPFSLSKLKKSAFFHNLTFHFFILASSFLLFSQYILISLYLCLLKMCFLQLVGIIR